MVKFYDFLTENFSNLEHFKNKFVTGSNALLNTLQSELKTLGIPSDVTYSVSGVPTTLAEYTSLFLDNEAKKVERSNTYYDMDGNSYTLTALEHLCTQGSELWISERWRLIGYPKQLVELCKFAGMSAPDPQLLSMINARPVCDYSVKSNNTSFPINYGSNLTYQTSVFTPLSSRSSVFTTSPVSSVQNMSYNPTIQPYVQATHVPDLSGI